MPNLISKIFLSCGLVLSACSLSAQPPTTPSALDAKPYSFDFQALEIGRVTQLIESIQPMDIVFAPNINLELTSPIFLKDSRLLDILQTALKPHKLEIKILDQDLFWIDQAQNAKKPVYFVRHQQALPLMPVELCTPKTNFILKQLHASNIKTKVTDLFEDFGKKEIIRAELNQQQIQIYCIRDFDDVSARIIVVGQQQDAVDNTLKMLIKGYTE